MSASQAAWSCAIDDVIDDIATVSKVQALAAMFDFLDAFLAERENMQ
ncbi:hypothetical protein ABZ540_09630 [Nocardia xishanensis]